MTAYKRRLQICFGGGSAAGEQQAPPQVAHRSRRWRMRRKGRRRRRKQGSACFERERQKERERETNKSRVLLSISCGASCFSLTSRRAGIHAHEWKQNWDSATSFPIRPATSGYHSLWTDKTWSLCAWLFASTGTATRELDLGCWDWTRTFPQRVEYRLASNRKDQMTEFVFEQLLLRFKRKVGWRRDGQAQKFEAQWKIKEFAGRTTAAESSRSADSLEMHALPRSLVRYSMETTR